MARTPSMTAEQAEAQLGQRGSLNVNSSNKGLVCKWLSAKGFPYLFSGGLSYRELGFAYNQTDGSGLAAIQKKYDAAQRAANADAGDDDGAFIDAVDDLLNRPERDAPTPAELIAVNQAMEAPKPPVAPKPVKADAHDDTAMDTLRNLILGGHKPELDADAVRRIVDERVLGIAPQIIHVQYPNREAIEIKGRQHPEFERALKYLLNGANVMLVGPAGCGKSHLAEQLAQALDVALTMMCGSAGASESEVKGWLLPTDGGAFEYCPSQFVTRYENGYTLICLDEMDAYDPNMLLSVNVPLANGHMYIPQRRSNPVVTRGERVFFLGTMNTFGTGANPVYTARNGLDEASRDRWLFITVDYDKALEEQIGLAGGLSVAEMAGIWELRDKCREAQLRRVISTRAFQKAVTMKKSGDTWKDIRGRLLEGWTKDEKAKVGIAA